MGTFHDSHYGREGVFKKFWSFLKGDSWASLIVVLIIAFALIRFLIFPGLSYVTGTPLPLVIVESCSMYHSQSMETILKNDIYKNNNISFEEAKLWPFQRGLSKGDVIFVVGVKKENVKLGDVLIFSPNQDSTSPHPIIHRAISLEPIATKGDHNSVQLTRDNNPYKTDETSINGEQIIGKAVFRIPFVGWAKLIFFEFTRQQSDRGLC